MALPEDRYAAHAALPEIGREGQGRLGSARVLIVGAGALGCAQATLVARAGVGSIRIVDRDVVHLDNLQRQILFDESDAREARPKATAASEKLSAVNGEVRIEGVVVDVGPGNAEALVAEADAVLDACDNVETRYVINDASVKRGTPWIYGGVLGTRGMMMPVLPGEGPCFRCLFPEPPDPGSIPSPREAGILSAAPLAVASFQTASLFRILIGREPVPVRLLTLDPWTGEAGAVRVERDPDCEACARGHFAFLSQSPGFTS